MPEEDDEDEASFELGFLRLAEIRFLYLLAPRVRPRVEDPNRTVFVSEVVEGEGSRSRILGALVVSWFRLDPRVRSLNREEEEL